MKEKNTMPIRKKLLLSNIAMIIIPVVVFVLTAILLVGVSFKEMTETNSGDGGGIPVISFFKNGELFNGLVYVIDYDPEIVADSRFLRQAEQFQSLIDIVQPNPAGIARFYRKVVNLMIQIVGVTRPIILYRTNQVLPLNKDPDKSFVPGHDRLSS
jgi:hypothetical protein